MPIRKEAIVTAHTDAQFEGFLANLKPTNQGLDFFSDFDKIASNTMKVKIKLSTLNALLGVSNLRTAVKAVWDEAPKSFEVLPILVAVRDSKTVVRMNLDEYREMRSFFGSVDSVLQFLEGTGLKEVFMSKKISNLVDYVFGIETGLDTNARKNRSGIIMEDDIAEIFTKNGIKFESQYSSKRIPVIQNLLGKDVKVFDFMIKKGNKTYLIETNFYSGGGSKLNEVARSYLEVAAKVNSVSGYEFVWITDGAGWHSAKSKLAPSYKAIPHVYNFTDLDNFLALVK